jgi:hypothetical protein
MERNETDNRSFGTCLSAFIIYSFINTGQCFVWEVPLKSGRYYFKRYVYPSFLD